MKENGINKQIIVATRGSLLALTQTNQTIESIRKLNNNLLFETKIFKTLGDNEINKPLISFGGTGVFVKELENALLNYSADIAIHSLKDVPSKLPDGLMLSCFPKRENVSDLFITNNNNSISDLPKNIKIGTGSPRRIIQLKKMFPNANFIDLRGNIDTRIRKLNEGYYDAIIIAAAGMKRLSKKIPTASYLNIEDVIPAVGQGAIAIECRADDKSTIEIINKINHLETEIAVKTERIFMAEIEGGCKFPLAAYAKVNKKKVELLVMAGELKTGQFIKKKYVSSINDCYDLAKQAAHELLESCHKQGIKLFN